MTEKTAKKEIKNQQAFSKEQLLESKRYQDRRDTLGAILEDGKAYTLAEADKLLEEFMKGKVK